MILAREAAVSGHALVFAAGGDGTLGDVANGLAGTETIMAPLPVGTANSFAKELCMPRPNWLNRQRLLQTAAVLADGVVHAMDLGYTHLAGGNGRYWLLWAGAGADGWLVDQIEPRPRWSKKLGALGYVLQGLMVAYKLPRMHASVEVDGRFYDGEQLMVLASNCRLYAGGEVVLSPQARLDDGLFEVWLLGGRGLSAVLRYMWQMYRGVHMRQPSVQMVNGRYVYIEATPAIQVQTDGEKAGFTPLRVEIKPKALRLLVPSTAPKDLFTSSGEPL